MSVLQRRAELLAELVAAATERDSAHPGTAAIARACKEQIDFHSFLDTHPPTVEQDWDQLRERVESHAQFDKANALAHLAGRLLATDTSTSTQRDFPHRILSFLLSAAQGVLQTEINPASLTEPQKGEEQVAAEAVPLSDDEGSDAAWWASEVPLSPDVLSDWSGDEADDGYLSDDAAAAGQRYKSPAKSPEWPRPRGLDPLDAPLTPLAPIRPSHRSPSRSGPGARQLSPWRRRSVRPYGPTSLSVWLAAKDSSGHPAGQLDPRRCFSQRELVVQVSA